MNCDFQLKSSNTDTTEVNNLQASLSEMRTFHFPKPYFVNLYIDGKDVHLGPFLLEVFPNMTIRILKMKVAKEFHINTDAQCWILGNSIAYDPDRTLQSYGVQEGSYVFLYLELNKMSNTDLKIWFKNISYLMYRQKCGLKKYSLKQDSKMLDNFEVAKRDMMNQNSVDSLFSSSSTHQNRDQKHVFSSLTNEKGFLFANKPSTYLNKHDLKADPHHNNEHHFVDPVCAKNLSPDFVIDVTSKCNNSAETLKSKVGKNTLKKLCKSQVECNENFLCLTKSEDSFCKEKGKKLHSVLSYVVAAQIKVKPSKSDYLACNTRNIVNDTSTCDETNVNISTSSYAEVSDKCKQAKSTSPIKMDENEITEIRDPSSVSLDTARPTEQPETKSVLESTDTALKSIEVDTLNRIPSVLSDEAKQNYQLFLHLENMDLIENVDVFDCPVCFSTVLQNNGVILHNCLHSFCKECLAKAVLYSDESSVKCPFRNDVYSCESFLQEREIKALVAPTIYEQYLQRSLVTAECHAENSFHCKTPDCSGWCLYEDNVNIFHCPVCSHYNCLTCQVIHEGYNCRQYQDYLKQQAKFNKDVNKTLEFLDKMVQNGQAMKCPKCSLILMKKWGCDWVKCSVCQTEICWVTKGPRWGPNGRGDTSAGCKCGANGVKCHPSCTYCH